MPKGMQLDPAVVKALGLDTADASTATVTSHGGSGFSSTARISYRQSDGSEKQLFMKTGVGHDKAVMFEGEHASLNAIHASVPTLCPASLAFGRLENSPGWFMVTDFLDFSPRPSEASEASSGLSLAQKLAKLHTTPAPLPEGHCEQCYGFPSTTCCGDTPQPNGFKESWAEFYAEHRLKAILSRSEQNNGRDTELTTMVDQIASEVVPRLLGDSHLNNGKKVMPVVCHGDLWSGNKGVAVLAGRSREEVIYDPR